MLAMQLLPHFDTQALELHEEFESMVFERFGANAPARAEL
jgi:hypothetical protein